MPLFDVEALELIEPPPTVIRSAGDFRAYQDWMSDLITRQDMVFLAAEMGLGKAQPLDTKVKTPKGDVRIGDLRAGDAIFAADGSVQRVTGVFPQGEQDTYRVRFRDGTATECNMEHLWTARAGSARDRSWRTYSLREMVERGISRQTKAGTNNRWEIPLCAPLRYPKQNVPVDPYTMGAILGDGCFTKGSAVVSVAAEDEAIIDRIATTWPVSCRARADGVRDARLLASRAVLRELGLEGLRSNEKHIPGQYLRGSVAQRTALLHGLMDTDGHCNKRGSAHLSTTAPQLAEDFRELVNSLGGVSIIRSYDRSHEDKPTEYQVTVKLNTNPFTLPRKAERWRKPTGQCRVQRRITAVEFVRREPQVCISVSSPDRLYLTDHCIVTHNTAAVLHAIRQLLDLGEIKHVLIVAPLKVAELTWPEEIAKWSFARALEYRVVTGTAKERLAALKHPAEVTIINRENVVWLKQTLGTRGWPFDMLVYDEASRLKGGSKRTKGNVRKDGSKSRKRLSEFGILTQMRFTFKKIVELSGTPASNGVIDLWGPVYIMDRGYRLGTSRTKFTDRWFRTGRDGYRLEPFDHSEREIMENIKDVFFSLKEKDYLELPPRIDIDHWVDLPPKAMEQYRRMEKNMVLREFDVEAVNNGVLTNKLLQIANGSLYLEDGGAERLHDAKLDKLDSIVTEAMGQPILLAYQFKFDKDAIKRRFPFARIFGESASDKRDWDAGRIKLLVTHPASAGHGLNLQFGGNIMVWMGLVWSLELYQQFVKRLHRSGQMADRVFLHRILARKTADEAIAGLITQKGVTQDRITDAVRIHVEQGQEEMRWRMAT